MSESIDGKIELRDYQLEAVSKIKNGCIVNGGVGSGKSRTGLAYYYLLNGGSLTSLQGGNYVKMVEKPKDLYIITTARKRDTKEWEGELVPFLMMPNYNIYKNKVVIDSWNNISKYNDICNSFFIFDEDRVTGYGAWVKSFLKIVKSNEWIILSATAGDKWTDYIPVFIANGFYKNKTEFMREHCVMSKYTQYPKVEKYLNTGKLLRLRNEILIPMNFIRDVQKHSETIWCDYDLFKYKQAGVLRWDPFKDIPIANASGMCSVWRKIVNSDKSHVDHLLNLFRYHRKIIVFYNFDYELDLLKTAPYSLTIDEDVVVAEWNGHKHDPIPETDNWVYLVNYMAGAEGWNCTSTDTMIFYSDSYSYKIMVQAAGRIDRMNTPYKDLYYYHLKTKAPIDLAISRALKSKKDFNERKFINW